MKKIISALLIVLTLFSFNIVGVAQSENDVMSLLSELKIMTGDPNGDLRLNDYVTRAEFAKIAVNSSSYKNSVATSLNVSPFSDVTYKHWSAPYVKVAVESGICEGYTDSTFKPDNNVSFEEAVTMMLRVLGYTDDDFGISWPYGQIGMANNLDMTENVNANVGEALTRRQVATLVFNSLNTKTKSGNSELLNIFDCTRLEDVTLIATKNENRSLDYNKISTTNGTYTIKNQLLNSHVGKKGDLYVKNGTDAVAFVSDSEDTTQLERHIVYSVVGNSVATYCNNASASLSFNSDTTVYVNSSATSYAQASSKLEMGDLLFVKRKTDGGIDYATLEKGNVEGPKTVTSSNWLNELTSNTSSVAVMRNGVKTTSDKIELCDVVYYLPDLNTVLAYSKKITGVYENALPNKDAPASITLSGTSYNIESVEAFAKLSSSGSFTYGDTITILLGKDNEIADVISPEKSQEVSKVVGYVTGYGTKQITKPDTTTYTGYYVRLALTDGNEYEYMTTKSYETMLNTIVSLNFNSGVAKVTELSPDNSVSGTVDWENKKIGSTPVSQNVNIIDVATLDYVKKSSYKSIFPQRIDGVNISGKVLYANKSSSGEITDLILSDVSGDAYEYGLVTAVTKAKGSTVSSSFSYDVNGNVMNYAGSTAFSSISKGTPIAILYSKEGRVDYAKPLTRVSGVINSVDSLNVKTSSDSYRVSDKAVVYVRDYDYNYTLCNIEDVDVKNYNVSAYYDRTEANGGRIRIIVANPK